MTPANGAGAARMSSEAILHELMPQVGSALDRHVATTSEWMPHDYVPYEEETGNALKRAQPVELLLKRAPEEVQRHLAAAGRSQESVKFLPLRGKQADGAVLLDAKTGAPLDILLVDPW